MNKLFLATCAATATLACSTAALAGDLGLAGASYDWSGGYVGINAGAAINNSTFSNTYRYTGQDIVNQANLDLINALDTSWDPGNTVFTGGVLAGYSQQYGSFVVGVEGDFNYTGFDATLRSDASGVMSQVLPPARTEATNEVDYKGNWFGTVRGRLGYAFDNLQVYGTGGLAYGKLDIKQSLVADNGGDSLAWQSSREAWKLGWTLGGGLEYGIDAWTVGLEYLYVDLNSYEWDSKAEASLSDPNLQADWSQVKEKGNADYAFSVVRATAKYRF